MRLILKFAAGLLFGMCLVLVIHGWLTVHREVQTFKADKEQAATLLGHALAVAVTDTWHVSGKKRALVFLQKVAARDTDVGIRWVDLKQPGGTHPHCPGLSAPQQRQLGDGKVTSVVRASTPLGPTLCTFTPLSGEESVFGAIEIRTSLAGLDAYVHRTVWRLVFAILVILAINMALSIVLGGLGIGRPIRRLIIKAQAVGGGDFETPVELTGRDELTDLAREINQMSDRLATARDALEAEHKSNLAAQAQLRHAERLATVGKLAAGIAHEVGTPLNVVDGHAKAIIAGRVAGDGAVSSAEVICRQTKRITELFRRLMRFSRRKEPQKAPVNLLQLVLDVVGLLESVEKKSGVKLVVLDSTPLKVRADAVQIQQVLTNLINNGSQATPKGGQVTVEVQNEQTRPPEEVGEPEQDYCCITVTDRGEGISEEDLPHVFDPFFTTKDVGEGTGLGLSIAHAIVRDHGGWIDVKSEPGNGSSFAVYLPKAVN